MDTPTLYCEHAQHLLQPINTISSLAFLVVGVLALRYLKRHKSNTGLYTLPVLLIFGGIGSALWHFTSQPWADFLDGLFIALFSIALSYFFLQSFLKQRAYIILGIIGLAIVSLSLERVQALNGSLVYVFLLTILGIFLYLSVKRFQLSGRVATYTISLSFLALIARIVDQEVCQFIPFGTHFIWHILMAISAYYIIQVIFLLSALPELYRLRN